MRRTLVSWGSSIFRVALTVFAVSACATPKPPNLEDAARTVAPIPACLSRLPPRTAALAGTPRTLPPSAFWPIVFRDYDAKNARIGAASAACNGDSVLAALSRAGGHFDGRALDEHVVLAKGPDRLIVVWLRPYEMGGGGGGALALVRAMDSHAELYGVAPYAAPTLHPALSIERSGGSVVVLSQEDGCSGPPSVGKKLKQGRISCLSSTRIFALRRGRLQLEADIASERIDFKEKAEAGTRGPLEYHLTSRVNLEAGAARVRERLVVRELETERDVRVAERERRVPLTGSGAASAATSGSDSLWKTVFESP